ncbi:pre-toxin TG domain-containing protein [Micromonospora sp. NPDC005305]|uniref:pre-toxin TG domain-containing protein n=1 Tax=Micromonospora sp. NPDC005305 TaxID=3156875 RepID=UPI00339F6D23
MRKWFVASFLALVMAVVAAVPHPAVAAPATGSTASTQDRLVAFRACLDREGGSSLLRRVANLRECAEEAGYSVEVLRGCLAAGEGAPSLADRITRVSDCLDEAGLHVASVIGRLALYVEIVDIFRSAAVATATDARDLAQRVEADLTAGGRNLAELRAAMERQVGRPLSVMGAIGEWLRVAAELGELFADASTALPEINKHLDEANQGVAQANAALRQMNGAMVTVNQAFAEMNAGLALADQGMTQLNAGIARANAGMRQAVKGVEQANAGLAEANAAVARLRLLAPSFTGLGGIGGRLFDGLWEAYDRHTAVQPQYDLADFAGRPLEDALASLVADLIPGVGDVKGVSEAVYGRDLVTGQPLSGVERALGAIVLIRYAKPLYKGADSVYNAARLRGVFDAMQKGNDVVDSLRSTGKLPPNYITQAEASSRYGWEKGKALAPRAPGKALGGDVFRNDDLVLPDAPSRVWYEADIGQNYAMTRAKNAGTRLLYSSDGLMYVTPDHYESVYYVGRYK